MKKILAMFLALVLGLTTIPVCEIYASDEISTVSEKTADNFNVYGNDKYATVGAELTLTPTVYDYTIYGYADLSDPNFSFKWYRELEGEKEEISCTDYDYTFVVSTTDFYDYTKNYLKYVCEVCYGNESIGYAYFIIWNKDTYYKISNAYSEGCNVALRDGVMLEFSMKDYQHNNVDLNSGEFSFEWYKGERWTGDYEYYDEERDGKLLGNKSTFTIESTVLEDYYSYLNGYKCYYCKIFKGDLFIDVVYFRLTCDELDAYEFDVWAAGDYYICTKEGESVTLTPEIRDCNYNYVELTDPRFSYQWYKVDDAGKKSGLLRTNSVYEITSVEMSDYTGEEGRYCCEVYVDGYCVGTARFCLVYDSDYNVQSNSYKSCVGDRVVLEPLVEYEGTWEYITEFDDLFSFEWYRENDSKCIGEGSKYVIESATEEDFSVDNQYYCKVFYKGVYIGETYITISYNYTVTGQTYYKEIGESVTLKPTIYKGKYTYDNDDNIIGELADLNDPNFTYEWILRSEDGDNEGLDTILSTESTYTIDNITEADTNEDYEGYYFRCTVYYKGVYVGRTSISIVSRYQVGTDNKKYIYVPDGGSTTLTPYIYDRVSDCDANINDSKFSYKWYKRSGKKIYGVGYEKEYIGDDTNIQLRNLSYEDSYDNRVCYYCEVYINGQLRDTEYKYIYIQEYNYECDDEDVFAVKGDNLKLNLRIKDYKGDYVKDVPEKLTYEWYAPTTIGEEDYDYGEILSTSSTLELNDVQDFGWYACKLYYNGTEIYESSYVIKETSLISVTNVENLQSEHPLNEKKNITWQYTLSGAENLKIQFSTETDYYVYISDNSSDIPIYYSYYRLRNMPVYVKGDTVNVSICSNDYEEDYGFKVISVTDISTEQMEKEIAEMNKSEDEDDIVTDEPTTQAPEEEQTTTKTPLTGQDATKEQQTTRAKNNNVKTPKASKIKKIKKAKKSLKVTWKKVKGVKGYQLQYSTSKKFKKAKKITIKKAKTTSKTIKKLKAKKKYYVRIRTYITVKGKKYYSKWSKAKSQKTK